MLRITIKEVQKGIRNNSSLPRCWYLANLLFRPFSVNVYPPFNLDYLLDRFKITGNNNNNFYLTRSPVGEFRETFCFDKTVCMHRKSMWKYI